MQSCIYRTGVATLALAASLCVGQQFTWMPFSQGENKTPVEDSSIGSPTLYLINIYAPVTFSRVAMRVTVADPYPADLYATGVFSCPPNAFGLASDCAQIGVPMTAVCDIAPRPLSTVSRANTPQLDRCRQGTVTLVPGTYAVLGVGNSPNLAFCQGRQGTNNVIPIFVHGLAQNADLENVWNGADKVPYFVTTNAPRFTADACAISLMP